MNAKPNPEIEAASLALADAWSELLAACLDAEADEQTIRASMPTWSKAVVDLVVEDAMAEEGKEDL